jgi:hypothetical protein
VSADFSIMLAKGDRHQKTLIDFMELSGVPYMLAGQEHRPATPEMRERMRAGTDRLSRRTRFYPDLIVYVGDRPIFVEPKNSTGIERECFRAYLEIEQEYEQPFWLYLKDQRLAPIRGLRFREPKEFDPISDIAVPIIDGYWVAPDLMPEHLLARHRAAYRKAGRHTSGKTYALIDFTTTESYPARVLLGKSLPDRNQEQAELF